MEFVNPHAPAPVSLTSLFASFWKNRSIIGQMVKRDIVGRYRGSVVGIFWSFFNPLLLLLMYTFVFSVVFKAKWSIDVTESRSQFAILLFIGMIVYGILAETLVRSPTLILLNENYVKKVVFPLEVLPVIALCSSIFHSLISIAVLSLAILFFYGFLPWTILLLPIVLLPLTILTLGFGWILAWLGVYLRDIAQPISLLVTILLFASPIFYPASAIPEKFRVWLILNPLTFMTEQARKVAFFGELPNWQGLVLYSLVSIVVAWFGFISFQKTRKGFANVL